jgi:hypothetical protein
MSITTNLALNEPAYNSTSPTWDQPLNYNATILDQMYGNTTSVAVSTSSSTTYTNITAPSSTAAGSTSQAMRFNLTGALAANQNVLLPQSVAGMWVVSNNTTNAFTVTLGSNNGSNVAAGTTVACPQGYSIIVYCDGTNVKKADDGLLTTLSTLTVTGDTYLATTSGSVGIGTSSPSYALHVSKSVSGAGVYATVQNTNTAANSIGGFIAAADGANNYSVLQQVVGGTMTFANNGAGPLNIETIQAQSIVFYTNTTQRFNFGPAGQLGIGASYGTAGQVIVSGGPSAAPSWGSAGLGNSSQTWQNVTRTSGTTYTNSTGAGIMVTINPVYSAGSQSIIVVVGGVQIYNFGNGGGGYISGCSFVVPAGATYVITYTLSTATISELR